VARLAGQRGRAGAAKGTAMYVRSAAPAPSVPSTRPRCGSPVAATVLTTPLPTGTRSATVRAAPLPAASARRPLQLCPTSTAGVHSRTAPARAPVEAIALQDDPEDPLEVVGAGQGVAEHRRVPAN
jgi:hypothetical protein